MKDELICFSSNLKSLRLKAGLSRAALAKMISYSEKSIEKWEMTSALPPVSIVSKLAKIFGVTVDNILYSSDVEIKCLLGIDGGGTKTEFLLTKLNGEKVDSLLLGSSNPVDIGIEKSISVLKRGIDEICSGVNKKEISVFAGLSGGSTGNNKKEIEKFLSTQDFGYFANGSDTENALELALSGDDGVAVIMGTGIIALAQKKGLRKRVGGWGYLIDKGGSGFNFGSDALDSALKAIDGRGGSILLKDMIEEKIGKPLDESIGDIYLKGKTYIASFAECVFRAFEQGDAVAEQIIERNVEEVSRIITSAHSFFDSDEVKIVICGGLSNRKEILSNYFDKFLNKNIKIIFNNDAMVKGAVALASKNLNAEEN